MPAVCIVSIHPNVSLEKQLFRLSLSLIRSMKVENSRTMSASHCSSVQKFRNDERDLGDFLWRFVTTVSFFGHNL
jgi:hypothetical protein